ncbi:MAG: leucine-rich repeat domain-containing protein, partial [Eubacterium sp.]|nr:leucine-rich repeat domain-containing protein [Eubacterium sp.]
LEQVDFSSGLKSIGEYAFNKCSLLSEAILPSGLTSIGKYAFEDCKGLTDISIPSSLTSIDECAFKGCSALTYVDIPGSVLSTGVGAFYNCTALKTVVLHEGLTEIGNYSFINCTSLNEVDIPNGVQTIGSQAFDGCSSITSVNIPNSVETIGSYAFRNCSSLTSIVLPNNLQKIERYTFRDCKNLKNILIPVSVTEIASDAFYSSNAITDVYYSGTENQYNLITNVSNITPLVNATKHYNYIPPCEVHTPYEAIRENEIAPTCTEQGSYDEVVYCSVCGMELSREQKAIEALGHNYSAVVTAPTCTAQGYTTYTCTRCRESYISDYTDTLEHTPAQAVRENEIPSTCAKKGSYDEVVYCAECHTELSREAKEIDALSHTAVIDEAVAPTCTQTGLTEGSHCSVCNTVIVAQQTVNALGHNWSAWQYEASTKTHSRVCINDSSHKEIAACSFNQGVRVKAPTCTEKGTKKYTCTVCGGSYTEDVAALGHNYNAVNIEPSITQQGCTTYTCSRCYDSYSDNYSEYLTGYCGENVTFRLEYATGILTISGTGAMTDYENGKSVFKTSSLIKSVVIDDGVTSVGSYAFAWCTELENVSLANSVTSIGSYAFENCTSLESIDLPDNLETIGCGAFRKCTNLGGEIVIPDGISTIGYTAFFMNNMESVVIPLSVTTIEWGVFYDCASLQDVYYY